MHVAPAKLDKSRAGKESRETVHSDTGSSRDRTAKGKSSKEGWGSEGLLPPASLLAIACIARLLAIGQHIGLRQGRRGGGGMSVCVVCKRRCPGWLLTARCNRHTPVVAGDHPTHLEAHSPGSSRLQHIRGGTKFAGMSGPAKTAAVVATGDQTCRPTPAQQQVLQSARPVLNSQRPPSPNPSQQAVATHTLRAPPTPRTCRQSRCSLWLRPVAGRGPHGSTWGQGKGGDTQESCGRLMVCGEPRPGAPQQAVDTKQGIRGGRQLRQSAVPQRPGGPSAQRVRTAWRSTSRPPGWGRSRGGRPGPPHR